MDGEGREEGKDCHHPGSSKANNFSTIHNKCWPPDTEGEVKGRGHCISPLYPLSPLLYSQMRRGLMWMVKDKDNLRVIEL